MKISLGASGDSIVVGDENHGYLGLLAKVFEEVKNFFAGFAVEVACGFVSEEEFGFGDEGSGKSDALLLSSREFVGAVLSSFTEANFLEEVVCFLESCEAWDAIEEQWKSCVFLGGEGG